MTTGSLIVCPLQPPEGGRGSCWHWAILGDLGDPPPTPVFWGSHSRKRGFFLIGLLRVDLCATVDPGYTHSSLSASSFEDNCTTLEPPPPRQTCASQHPLPGATKVSPTKVSPGQSQACAKFCLLQPERQEKCKAHRAKRMRIASSLLYRHVKERSPCMGLHVQRTRLACPRTLQAPMPAKSTCPLEPLEAIR